MLARPAPAPVQAAMNLSTLEACAIGCIAPVQYATPVHSKSGRRSVPVVTVGVKPEFQEGVLVDPVVINASAPAVASLRLLQGGMLCSPLHPCSVCYTEAVGGELPLCCRISARYVHAVSESIWNAAAHSTFPVLIARSTAAQMAGRRESGEWRTRESQ